MSDVNSEHDPLIAQSDLPPAAPATVNREETAAYWRDKYNGLNGHATKLQKQFEKTAGELAAIREEKEGEVLTLSQEKARLLEENTTTKAALAAAAAERDNLKSKATLSASIREVSPELAAQYDAGLLLGIESLTPEERTAHLTRLVEHQGLVKREKVLDKTSGALPPVVIPPSPRKEGVTTRADANNALQKTLSTPGQGFGSPEYNAALAEYTRVVMADAK